MDPQYHYVFEFNGERVDGRGDMKEVLGGKGAGLAEMCRAGLPVPPGFTISTLACRLFNRDREAYRRQVLPEVRTALERLEKLTGRRFGGRENPLLLSVRSGAKFSMPGMMDTVLDIGLNEENVALLARQDPLFAYDCYRRLLQMFGDVVLGIPEREFEGLLQEKRRARGVSHEIELPVEDLQELCRRFQEVILRQGKTFPQDPEEQLLMAIEAVFNSWNNPRARDYRRMNNIPEDLGTAVNVQTMVFGNRGSRSASGVGFTRDPATGEKRLYGEFLPRAQGEEVVAGTRTPLPLEKMQEMFPGVYGQLQEIAGRLERHYREMQDFEFTVEEGVLYMLQTRTGKRTGMAAVRIACDMYREGLIDRKEAILRVEPRQLAQLLHPVFKEGEGEVLARGLPASPGAAVGKAVFSKEEAVRRTQQGERVILVRMETTPDDIQGMEVAEGILTARGGMTSHAAVVARSMGKCCVVGCEELHIDEEHREARIGDLLLREGDVLSVDGSDGRVMAGSVERIDVHQGQGILAEYLALLEEVPCLPVRANADTPRDAARARAFGAVGIGLCRTEHMFFGTERLKIMQEMILAASSFERQRCLDRLQVFQEEDFYEILRVMDGLPVTVRLLDPPLHEFLPRRGELVAEIQRLRAQGEEGQVRQLQRLLERADELQEANPMLGHRGCRLGITYPEITRMQVRALFRAACRLRREGLRPMVEIMVPLVSMVSELHHQRRVIEEEAAQVLGGEGCSLSYQIGTMIEVPRAALVAGQIAREADFFSFGTNDLTQTTFGFSRDDAARFIEYYRETGLLNQDPFQTLDREGVGALLALAVREGRKAKPDLKIGLCGEHGGDEDSVAFCHQLGLDYVSCSPYRVPVARLAAAQAALRSEQLAAV